MDLVEFLLRQADYTKSRPETVSKMKVISFKDTIMYYTCHVIPLPKSSCKSNVGRSCPHLQPIFWGIISRGQNTPHLCLVGLPVGLGIMRGHDFLVLLLTSLLCRLLRHASKHTDHHERQEDEDCRSRASGHRHNLSSRPPMVQIGYSTVEMSCQRQDSTRSSTSGARAVAVAHTSAGHAVHIFTSAYVSCLDLPDHSLDCCASTSQGTVSNDNH